jgi:archaetidylinositol phosphate synthase
MADAKTHTRKNPMLLGELERPALQWLAAHTPAWMKPDHLSAIGTLGSVLIFLSYWWCHISPAFLWLASLGFVINWVGDSLDGTLARFRKIERPKYGFFLDHTLDAIGQVLIFLGLGASPYVDSRIASLALIGYLLMSNVVYINTIVNGEFRIAYLKLGPTEMRVIAILANTLIFFIGNPAVALPYVGPVVIFDIIVSAIAALLIGGFLGVTFIRVRELARVEPEK